MTSRRGRRRAAQDGATPPLQVAGDLGGFDVHVRAAVVHGADYGTCADSPRMPQANDSTAHLEAPSTVYTPLASTPAWESVSLSQVPSSPTAPT